MKNSFRSSLDKRVVRVSRVAYGSFSLDAQKNAYQGYKGKMNETL